MSYTPDSRVIILRNFSIWKKYGRRKDKSPRTASANVHRTTKKEQQCRRRCPASSDTLRRKIFDSSCAIYGLYCNAKMGFSRHDCDLLFFCFFFTKKETPWPFFPILLYNQPTGRSITWVWRRYDLYLSQKIEGRHLFIENSIVYTLDVLNEI